MKNNQIAVELFTALIAAISRGEHTSPIASFLGASVFSEEEIQTIRSLSNEQQERLAQTGHSAMNVTVNRRSVTSMCALLKEGKARSSLINEMLIAGATQAMMYDYFGITVKEIASLRRKLDIRIRGGRPTAILEKQEQLIWHTWRIKHQQYRSGQPIHQEAEICLEISKQTQIHIASVYAQVKELQAVATA